MCSVPPRHTPQSLFPGHEGAWPRVNMVCPVLIPKTPHDSGLFVPSWVWSFQLLEMGLETGNLVPEPPAWTPPVMPGQAGEPVVLGHETKRRMEPIQDTPAPRNTPLSAALCPAPVPGIAEEELDHCQPSPKPHPWAVPAPCTARHGRRQAPKSKGQRLASISVFTSRCTASHTHPTDTPSRRPPSSKALFKHVKHFCHHPRGVGARRLSASSPAPRQKWGEWQRCCPSRPWWPPF